jgi:hypothetical protein
MDPVTGIPISCFVEVGAHIAEIAGYVEEPAAQRCLVVVQCVVEEETPSQQNKRLARLHEKGEVVSRLGLGTRQEEAGSDYREREKDEVRSRLGL